MKAQVEMMGLVIIVLLITIGMLFLAQFALKDTNEQKIFTRKGLAYSAVSALLKTSAADCSQNSYGRPPTMQDVIIDCAENSITRSSNLNCGTHACTYLEETFTTLLNESIGSKNKQYHLEISQADNPEFSFLIASDRGQCLRERDSSGAFPLPSRSGIIESILFVCD